MNIHPIRSDVSSEKKTQTYKVNEFFLSLQGEGLRAGTLNYFLRLSNCNLKCAKEKEGFDCDTEFESGRRLSLDEIVLELKKLGKAEWVILTGGEPSLQMDDALLDRLHKEGWKIAIETNGTREISSKVDWICVSPKTAMHTIRQKKANEVKIVRAYGQMIPPMDIEAEVYWLSPAFEAEHLPQENLKWCIDLIKENPQWRLSVQQHKIWGVR